MPLHQRDLCAYLNFWPFVITQKLKILLKTYKLFRTFVIPMSMSMSIHVCVQAAYLCPSCMFMSNLRVHAARSCPCSMGMDMQHGHGHPAWTCSVDFVPAAWTWTSKMDMGIQHRHEHGNGNGHGYGYGHGHGHGHTVVP